MADNAINQNQAEIQVNGGEGVVNVNGHQVNGGGDAANVNGNQVNGAQDQANANGIQVDGNGGAAAANANEANAVPEMLPYTTDEDFAEIRDKDKHVEIIGYVDAVHAPTVVGRSTKYDLFKFVLSNGSTSRVTCLVWGLPLIKKHVDSIAIDNIIHIEAATSKSVMQEQMKNNLIGMELLIKDDTIVTLLGKHNPPAPDLVVPTEYTTVLLAETGKSQGIISVEGHIKIKFYKPEAQFNKEFGGIGCITDGQYKITINIVNYEELNFDKGVRVRVIGTVDTSGSGPVSIKCINDSCVTAVEGAERMSAADVSRGNKTPKRGRD